MTSERKAVTEQSAQSSHQRRQGLGKRRPPSTSTHKQTGGLSHTQGVGRVLRINPLSFTGQRLKCWYTDKHRKGRDADDPGKAFTEVTPVILGADAHSTLHSTGKNEAVMPVYTSAVALQGRKTPVMEKPQTTWARTVFKTFSKDTTVNCVVMKRQVPINLQLLQARYTCWRGTGICTDSITWNL